MRLKVATSTMRTITKLGLDETAKKYNVDDPLVAEQKRIDEVNSEKMDEFNKKKAKFEEEKRQYD